MSTRGVLLVTGGTGFVGGEVVRRAVDRGWTLHLVARPRAQRAPQDGATIHDAALEDPEALRRAFTRAKDAARAASAPLDVLHLAARISYRREDRELLWRANVEGTRHVLAAACAAGVRRFCHVSSVVALGPVASARDELDDDAPLGGLALDAAYARTKAEAERLAQAACAHMDVVVASPAVVFGVSGADSNSTHFLRRLLGGRLGPVSPPGSLSVVGLADAAEGILRVLERGVRGRRYLLGESAWRLRDLLALACELGGRPGPWCSVPAPVWRALVAGARVADRLRASERITPEALALLGLHFRFRARRAPAELGWTPTPFREVLAGILAHLEPAMRR